MTPEIRQRLHDYLRRPGSTSTVKGALPVLFFGDLMTARIATVALNPSDREYLDDNGNELDGPKHRRFHTLASLKAKDRASLSDEQCDQAVQLMRGYFTSGVRAHDKWFNHLRRFLFGMGGELRHRRGCTPGPGARGYQTCLERSVEKRT